ncbi:hypothetical protein HGRIS_008228 [Hohenbuehelia grisea]|uniref:Uncharacterized protein n=1 Tax=Hohenbuehelia grisea TaxID=104357 RepID=A0ABR3J7C2_9AGAR
MALTQVSSMTTTANTLADAMEHTLALNSTSTVPPSKTMRFERKLGNSELSYYLPSRENGVNDMYLHISFRAPTRCVRGRRPELVWAILRLRHPLLASNIVMNDYDDVRFVYTTHQSPEAALLDAQASLRYGSQTKDELLESYLNGPRTLSDKQLSCLFLSSPDFTQNGLPDASEASTDAIHECEYAMCTTHFLGDGMALHQFSNDFFGLLGGDKSDSELRILLDEEWQKRWADVNPQTQVLPSCMEDCLPPSSGSKFQHVAEKVDFIRNQEKQIGGHSFPRRSGKPCRTTVSLVPIEADRTGKILKLCKANGVSISAAMFAICNLAWAKIAKDKKELPMYVYVERLFTPVLKHFSG